MNSEVFARNPAGLREHFLEILGVQQPAYGAHGQESATGATTALAGSIRPPGACAPWPDVR